jgi:Putative metallopeptidase
MEHHMRNPPRSLSMIAAAAALTIGALSAPPARAQEKTYPGSIKIEYEVPKHPAMQKAYDMATGARSLEMMQVIFGSFRLPEDLSMKYVNCDGVPNAYFFRENDKPTIRVCYEYLTSVYDMMPKERTAEGITPREAFTGQLLFAVAHEFGHAVFDIYNLPVLGRQEDAADQFATHFLLHFGGALSQRLIWGAAYSYNDYMKNAKDKPKVTLPVTEFASDHGAPEQRFYNLVCIAYGFNAKIFATVVEKGYLPERRAKVCEFEYSNLSYAITKLVGPNIDQDKAEKAFETTETWSTAPFWHSPDPAQSSREPQALNRQRPVRPPQALQDPQTPEAR